MTTDNDPNKMPNHQQNPHMGDSVGGGDLSSRVARLEVHMGYIATKEDISRLKTWFLGGALSVIGGFIITAFLVLAGS